MYSKGEKRSLEKESNGQENQSEKRQRIPPLASVVVEAVKLDSLQKLCSTLEPLLRRVVGEEVERVLAKMASSSGTPCLQAAGGQSPRPAITGGPELRLQFRSKLALPLFTGSRVEGDQGSAIVVVAEDARTGAIVTTGLASSAKLEVCVLEGDFNVEDDEIWGQEVFEQNVVKERDGKRPLLTGETSVTLKEGVGTLGELSFTDNSSWIRSRKFRLGVKVVAGPEGMRIREAKTEAFTVKDHRGELYKKHYPPALHDEVWRLDRIGKDGAFHKRLNQAGIFTVEDFLRLVVMDPQKLRNTLGSGMSNKMWEGTVEHAKTCVLNGKLHVYYADEKQGVGVIFNNIFQLMGLIADGQYISVDALSDNEKIYVDKLVKVAYENWDDVVEYEGEEFGVRPNTDNGQPSGTVGQPSLLPERQGSVAEAPSSGPSSSPSVSVPAAPTAQSFLGAPTAFTDTANSVSGQELSLDQLPVGQSSTELNLQQLIARQSSPFFGGAFQTATPDNFGNLAPGLQLADTGAQNGAGGAGSGVDLALSSRGNLLDEEELRLKSVEFLENDDMHSQMQQLLHMFAKEVGDPLGTSGLPQGFGPEAALWAPGNFAAASPGMFMPDTPSGQNAQQRNNGKAFVGWLKLKAALRWGIFVRKRAAARRAKIQEVDED